MAAPAVIRALRCYTEAISATGRSEEAPSGRGTSRKDMTLGRGNLPFRDAAPGAFQRYNSGMATQATTLTECPKGHERWVTFQAGTPEREWVLICPLCGEERRIVLPEIVKADPS